MGECVQQLHLAGVGGPQQRGGKPAAGGGAGDEPALTAQLHPRQLRQLRQLGQTVDRDIRADPLLSSGGVGGEI